MNYNKFYIIYMTGTGNSYRTATWMIDWARKKNIEAVLINMESYTKKSPLQTGRDTLLGIIMPTHGFTAPWPAIKLAFMLPRGRGTGSFITPSRAGTKVGPYHLPGIEGTAGYLIALILALKGYSIRGVAGIDMPSNWTSFHWGLNPDNVKSIIDRAKVKSTAFIDRILAGKRYFPFGSFIELLLGLALLYVSIGYLLFGRFYLAKLFFANYKCNGCGICERNCPHGGVIMRGYRNPRPYWTFFCESCMRCMGYCPEKAIEASHSFAYILYLGTSIPASIYLLKWLNTLFPMISFQVQGLPGMLINYLYFFLSMFLLYMIFSLIIRFKPINMLFTFTTLTHIYRRYHEPGTKLKEIKVQNKLLKEK